MSIIGGWGYDFNKINGFAKSGGPFKVEGYNPVAATLEITVLDLEYTFRKKNEVFYLAVKSIFNYLMDICMQKGKYIQIMLDLYDLSNF